MRIKPGTLIALNPQLLTRIPSFAERKPCTCKDFLLYYGLRKECPIVEVDRGTIQYLKGTP